MRVCNGNSFYRFVYVYNMRKYYRNPHFSLILVHKLEPKRARVRLRCLQKVSAFEQNVKPRILLSKICKHTTQRLGKEKGLASKEEFVDKIMNANLSTCSISLIGSCLSYVQHQNS